MKILSISAQKPHSTGSGIYLTELVKGLSKLGHEQAIVAGVYESDRVDFPERTEFYPVLFKTERIPFAMPGMSDEMPYESTVYGTMTEEMTQQFIEVFERKIKEAVETFAPHVILCHHLYILTAKVRQWFPSRCIVGVCHGTDLRQMKKIPLCRELVQQEISKLDVVLALQENQINEIETVFGVAREKITVIGVGYNENIFYDQGISREETPKRITFAGKISEKKGVHCLIRAVTHMSCEGNELVLSLAGGYGNEKEYNKIVALTKQCSCKVEFLGVLNQTQLAELLNRSHVFVLPSFYEGLPLVLLEARACGTNVVCTDLPGVKSWLDSKLPNHGVSFIKPPIMKNTDEAEEASLATFEEQLEHVIEEKLKEPFSKTEGLESLSWSGICIKLNDIIEKINK